MERMLKWNHYDIATSENLSEMSNIFHATKHTAAAFDTEATGLHQIYDVPFLFQFGWYDETVGEGYTFVIDIETHPELARRTITVWHALVQDVPIYLGHNVTFDLHMLTNIGLPYQGNNIQDTQAYIRLGTDAIQESKGGAPLGLKKFATRYLTPVANEYEKELSQLRTAEASRYNKELQESLGWTKKKLQEFFDDKLNDETDLDTKDYDKYIRWKNNLPDWLRTKVTGYVESDMIQYDKISRPIVNRYAHYDVVLTLEVYRLLAPIVKARHNEDGLIIEKDYIRPVFEMERVGFDADIEYLISCKDKVKAYLRERRKDLCTLAGCEVKASQSKLILKILNDMGVSLSSTNKDELELILPKLKHEGNAVAADFIETLTELRTLEKWYSVYIIRFFVISKRYNTSKLYTSINRNAAITGRVSSDFQQFPKKAIKTIAGEELFNPRRLILVPKDHLATVYLDYSQIELRFQAFYTILVGHPDLNLCRAYMPYKCHLVDGTPFDYKNPWCIDNAYTETWYYDEVPYYKPWEPTDVHGATTMKAFGITEDDPQFKTLRYVGKMVNFAKNYGAQRALIRSRFPQYDEDRITQIDGAYYAAFPGVKEYHKYCYEVANRQAGVINLFGIWYYNSSGHNLINTLVQGSAAYFLKLMIIKVSNYLKEHNYKSKIQMQIHDELSFIWHKDDKPTVFFEIQNLMQEWKDTMVPIVADMEVTTESWADKYEVKGVQQLEDIRTRSIG